MLLDKLRKEVLQASLDLLNYNLVTLTGGNVSGRDEQTGYIAITQVEWIIEILYQVILL